MKNYVLKSNFKYDIQNFLVLKRSSGYKYTTGQILIEQFDGLCFSNYPNESFLTKDIALEWAIPINNESCSSLENRIVVVREFAKYLNSLNKIPITKSTLRKSFRNILNLAGIEKSKQNNPRIHDFRHTFAVNCLKNFVKENKNLTAYLPILKTYMGHSKFKSTEYYLKLTNDMFPDILDKVNSYTSEAIPRIGGTYEK